MNLIRDRVLYPRRDWRGRIVHDAVVCKTGYENQCEACRLGYVAPRKVRTLEPGENFTPPTPKMKIEPIDMLAALKCDAFREVYGEILFDLVADKIGQLVGEVLAERGAA